MLLKDHVVELTEVEEGDQSSCNDCPVSEQIGREEGPRGQSFVSLPKRESYQKQYPNNKHSNHAGIPPLSIRAGR
jgi:hypothetical protein